MSSNIFRVTPLGSVEYAASQPLVLGEEVVADAIRFATGPTGGITMAPGSLGLAVSTTGIASVTSTDNVASAIALRANGGTSETIAITASQGTGSGAVTVTATAGGVKIVPALGITVPFTALTGAAGATFAPVGTAVGKLVVTGLTTAAITLSAAQTVTCAACTASTSAVFAWVSSYAGTYLTNGYPVVVNAAPGSGSFTFQILNQHATNALSGNITVSFIVINSA